MGLDGRRLSQVELAEIEWRRDLPRSALSTLCSSLYPRSSLFLRSALSPYALPFPHTSRSSGEWPKNLASISDAKRYVEWAGVEDLAVHGFTTKVVDGKTHAIVCGGTDKATCEASIKEFDTTGQSANCNANNNRVNQGVVDECYAIPFTSDYILITKSSERCSPKHKYENGASTSGTGKWPIYESWPCDGSSSSSGSGGSSSSGGGGSVILIILLLICGGGGGAYYYGTKIPDGRIGKMIPPKYKWDVIGLKIQAAKAKVSSKRVVAPTPTADSA